jgi:hypothetical protein
VRAPTLLVVAVGALVCSACSTPAPTPDAGPPLASADPDRPWSRDAAVSAAADILDAGSVSDAPNATALDEIVAAADKLTSTPTDPKGGTLVGTETGVTPNASARPSASARARSPAPTKIGVGEPEIEPDVSSPAVEREGRAQLYWNLVQRCRAPDGSILPPEVVTLRFTIDADGYVVPGTIQSTASDPRWQQAASCMLRELSAASFRAPPSARGVAARVTATVPSVD